MFIWIINCSCCIFDPTRRGISNVFFKSSSNLTSFQLSRNPFTALHPCTGMLNTNEPALNSLWLCRETSYMVCLYPSFLPPHTRKLFWSTSLYSDAHQLWASLPHSWILPSLTWNLVHECLHQQILQHWLLAWTQRWRPNDSSLLLWNSPDIQVDILGTNKPESN